MNKTDQRRRYVLKGIAAAACYCSVPPLLIAQEQPQQAKVPKEQARYQSSPKDEMRCGNCTHFISDSSTCKLVEGKVEENGYCILWAGASG